MRGDIPRKGTRATKALQDFWQNGEMLQGAEQRVEVGSGTGGGRRRDDVVVGREMSFLQDPGGAATTARRGGRAAGVHVHKKENELGV
jgi:hypothetical protein